MKKTLLLLPLLLALFSFSVKAQITFFSEDFEGYGLPTGWTVLDMDGDGESWMHNSLSMSYMGGHESEGSFLSHSYDFEEYSPLTPDNWLVSPAITLSGNSTLTFWRMVSFFNSADHYAVYISTTSATDTSAFTMLYEETCSSQSYAWASRSVDLSEYTGNTVHIAFRHFNCSQRLIAIDDIVISGSTNAPLITTAPSSLHFVNVPTGTTSAAQAVRVYTYNVTDPVSASVPVPFEVSADNSNFSTSATMALSDTMLYVRYSPTAEGFDSTSMTLTSGTAITEVPLIGSSVYCNVDLPYEQNFNSAPEYGFPTCWSQINPFDGYPKTTDDYTSPGDNVLMFKCDFNNYQPIFAVMPQMPADLSNLQISFSTFREGSYSGTLSVGYVTNVADSSTFVPVWSINAAQIGDNNPHPYLVTFENVVTDPDINYYITFKYETSSNWYWFVDDVVVEELAPCSMPTGLEVSLVTSTSATVSWGGSASSYFLYYKSQYDTGYTEIQNVLPGENGYTIEELLPVTTYTWYVASVCDDGSTVNSLEISSFTTECSTYSTPFVQNFDGSTNVPLCWNRYNGWASDVFAGGTLTTTTSGWVFNSTLVFGASHPKVNIYGASCNRWLVSPPIDLGDLTNPVLTFDLALTSWNTTNAISDPNGQPDDKFMVIVSTDFGATWSAANATVWSNDGNGDYVFNQIPAAGQEVSISLSDYESQTVMIAFYGESSTANGDNDLHLDNVVVSNATSCTKPTSLSVVAVSGNSVTLGWIESGNATSWNIEYGPAGYQQGSSVATVVEANTNPYTINNLSANTYDFYVQSDCGADQSLWVGPISATPGSFNMGVTGYDSLTTCSLIIYDNGGPNGNYSASCDYTLVIYPETEGAAVSVSGSYATENNWDFLRIYDGVGTGGSLLGEFSGNGTVPTTVSSSGPLTVRFTSDAGMQYAGFMLTASCTSCSPAGNLTVSDLTDNSAEITWTGMASSYKFEYKAASATEWNTVILTDTSYTLNNLVASTPYLVNVYADCGDVFSPAVSITFNTTMHAVDIPYSTDFSDLNDQYWQLNNGACNNYWSIGTLNDSTSALFITNNGTTPGYNVNSFSAVSAEKLFTVGEAADLMINFNVKIGGEESYDYLKVFLAPADASYPATNTNADYTTTEYSLYAVNFSDFMQYSSFTSYPYKFNLTNDSTVNVSVVMANPNDNPTSTSTAKLVFLWKNDSSAGDQPGAIVYDVSIEALSCTPPTDLTIDNLISTDADISWTPGDQEETWNLEYREASTPAWTSVEVTGTPEYHLSGLVSGTTYFVRVQADCGGGQSLWLTESFYTPCLDAINEFPYNEGFENSGNMPNCWHQEYVTGSVNWTFQAGGDSHGNVNNAHSGNYNAFLFDESTIFNTTRLVSPIFDLSSLTNPYISFWYAQQAWGNGQDRLNVYYRTSASDEWQELTQYYGSVAVWTMDSIALPNPSATYQIAFSGIVNYGYGVLLDDITIAEGYVAPEPCDVPTNLHTTDIQNESISVAWDAHAGVSSWNIQYRPATADQWSLVNVNTNSYTITNLTGKTLYEIQVQANCADEQTSDWSSSITAQTTDVGIVNYLENSISLFPNPANDVVNVQCTMNNVQLEGIEVIDVYGKVVRTVVGANNYSPMPIRINVSGLANGMYFVRVTTDEGVVTKTFVKR